MKYVSTRGGVRPQKFTDIVLEGLAEDGGLYVPETFPNFANKFESWRNKSYQEICFTVFREFIDTSDMSDDELKSIIAKSYATFRDDEITPLKKLHGNVHILELFHGPTLAFKDVALQFLGNLFPFFLAKRNQRLRVLGATSGDTGSAALDALKDKDRIECCIMYPKDRTSKVQELQMTTVKSKNVQCLCVKGTFDDCQALVKQAFNSPLKKDLSLGAINSINWARIMAQSIYYFYAWTRIPGSDKKKITFAVPSGNFGDALAGYYAKLMGLPIHILVATNSNDILCRFFKTGTYEKFDVMPTISPSMDIQIASNFERYLYHLFDSDSNYVKKCIDEIQKKGYCEVSEEFKTKASKDITASSVSDKETVATIEDVFKRCNYVLCPHTAVGYNALMKDGNLDQPIVLVATAHFGKFMDSLSECDNKTLIDYATENMPPQLKKLLNLPRKFTIMNNDFEELNTHLRKSYDVSSPKECCLKDKSLIILGVTALVGTVAFLWMKTR